MYFYTRIILNLNLLDRQYSLFNSIAVQAFAVDRLLAACSHDSLRVPGCIIPPLEQVVGAKFRSHGNIQEYSEG